MTTETQAARGSIDINDGVSFEPSHANPEQAYVCVNGIFMHADSGRYLGILSRDDARQLATVLLAWAERTPTHTSKERTHGN